MALRCLPHVEQEDAGHSFEEEKALLESDAYKRAGHPGLCQLPPFFAPPARGGSAVT